MKSMRVDVTWSRSRGMNWNVMVYRGGGVAYGWNGGLRYVLGQFSRYVYREFRPARGAGWRHGRRYPPRVSGGR